jgi:undecaprenyl diphosphate synthase
MPSELNLERLPKHVAIIMDGNGRWAQKRGRPRVFGHVKGSMRVRDIVRNANKIGLKAITLYAFSTENWGRPSDEISVLMRLLPKWIKREYNLMIENNVRFRVIGDINRLPKDVIGSVQNAIEATKKNTGLQFTLALSYGSRDEIVNAMKAIATKVLNHELKISEIDSNLISQFLFDPEIGDPDLLIRTSGELRISNFLLWQLAYTELYFTDTYWPDFTIEEFHKALLDFSKRKRRFGLTQEQIQNSL